MALRMTSAIRQRSSGWAVCAAAALAASAAATNAHMRSDDAHHLESAGRLGGGSMTSSVLSYFTTKQHQKARAAGTAECDALLARNNTHRWVQQSASSPASAAMATSPRQHAVLRTKKIQSEYELQGVIGEGGFGRVHVARHRASNAQVAVKRVFKDGTTKDKFMQEVAILRHVGSNSSVLQLRDAFETADAYVLVTDFVEGGELYDDLVTNGRFDEQRASGLTREIASVLAFLHAKSVVHGDIKPENIMLTEDKNKSSSMRLIDFGQAFREDKVGERKRAIGSGVGTTAYAAPEFIHRSEAGAAVDVWALGVVLYIVLCGRHPFDPTNDASDDEIAARIVVSDFDCDSREWICMSPQAQDLIERMLTVDPSARITADEVLQHAWIRESGVTASA
ncbi:Camk protein kinase [Globisporangium polare]